jgi:hypothetical protein
VPAYHDHERVADAGDGVDQSDDDLVERLDALEEAEDAEGAQHFEHRKGSKGDANKGEDTDEDDDKVEDVPAARPEFLVPCAVVVEDELAQENDVADVIQSHPRRAVSLQAWACVRARERVDLLLEGDCQKVEDLRRGET